VGKSSKGAPPRRPVKAKGTIPTPRVGHRAARKPWYKHRQIQLIGGLVALVVIGLAATQVVAWRHRVSERNADRRAVKTFDDKIQALQGDLIEPLNGIQAVPDQFQNGQIKADDYKAAAQKWLATFQRTATELRSLSPPAELTATRAHFVESAVIFVDAVRTFQLAAQTTEPAVRDEAILLAKRETNHAETIYTNALKELAKEKKRVGLPAGSLPDTPELPQEDVAPQPAASPAPAPTAAPAPAPTG
jgi:hypothetical protein